MNKIKQYIALLFLSLFMFIKTVGLHSFVHSEEEKEEHCDICELVIITNTIHFLANKEAKIERIILHNYKRQSFDKYVYLFVKNKIDKTLFCRPPPTV